MKKYININTNKNQKYCSLEDEKLKTNIDKIENYFYRQHIKYVFYNRKNNSIINFLNDMVFSQPANIPENRKKIFAVNPRHMKETYFLPSYYSVVDNTNFLLTFFDIPLLFVH